MGHRFNFIFPALTQRRNIVRTMLEYCHTVCSEIAYPFVKYTEIDNHDGPFP